MFFIHAHKKNMEFGEKGEKKKYEALNSYLKLPDTFLLLQKKEYSSFSIFFYHSAQTMSITGLRSL